MKRKKQIKFGMIKFRLKFGRVLQTLERKGLLSSHIDPISGLRVWQKTEMGIRESESGWLAIMNPN